ncbi:hypothetical protein D3C73_1645570 [compost metagenome]
MLETFTQHLLVAKTAGGTPRAIGFFVQQVFQGVLGADTLVLAQYNDQQEAGADDGHRFQ